MTMYNRSMWVWKAWNSRLCVHYRFPEFCITLLRITKRLAASGLRLELLRWPEVMAEAMKEWKYNWKTETRGRASYRYTQEPTHKVLKLHQGRKKWQSALLIQMRTEKIGLRNHLWRRRVPEFDNTTCGFGQTVAHILIKCRKLRNLRREELSRIGRPDLRAILNEHKLATKAIRFMERTQILGQFRAVEQRI